MDPIPGESGEGSKRQADPLDASLEELEVLPESVEAGASGLVLEELDTVDAAEPAQPDLGFDSEATGPADRYRILVADPDQTTSDLVRGSLSSDGYQVVTVLSAVEVPKAIESLRPNLVILDAGLEGGSSYDICRSIRADHDAATLPVILLSGGRDPDSITQAFAAGASDFISRPVVPAELLSRIRIHAEIAGITTIYNRFVPTQLLGYLGYHNISDIKLGDQIQREMTVLFVDIRSFTSLSERMTPRENFKFINSYLSRINPLIRKYDGFVDKYIGDAVMAIFPGRPEDALMSANGMVKYLEIYNGYRKKSGYRPINVGIGIHTGKLILGIIGDSERMAGTVISDAVNLASRVQDVTKLFGSSIIISQDTFVRLENPTDFNFRFLGKVKVKGKVQTVSLFEFFDGDDPKDRERKVETKADFESAILLFSKRKFEDAAAKFRGIVDENPNDRAAALFLNRAELLIKREKANWLLSG